MLSAERVTKAYRVPRGRAVVLDGASLQLAPGARLGLVGPSGSGKSTFARILALLTPPDAGAVAVDGVPVGGWGLRAPRELRHKVQLVWQAPREATDPRLRLSAAILEPLAASGLLPGSDRERRALARASGERVGLTADLLDRFPHEVSEGQLQRACLARALIVEPRYLLCDELSSMLDVSTQAALLEVIAGVQRERDLGVLLVTHDRVLARHWCDGIAEL
jgi:peptide/nickel transport system ATP-binding protein